MSRIFLSLATLSTLLLSVAFLLGLRIGNINHIYHSFWTTREEIQAKSQELLPESPEMVDLQKRKNEQLAAYGQLRPRVTVHMMFGMLTALVTMLVHSVCVTYFIGTAKWCGEVVGAYQLNHALYESSRLLKRRCFHWSLLGICTLLLIVVLGASSDPGTLGGHTWNWVEPHLWAASLGIAITLLTFWKQWGYLLQNVDIIQQVQEQVQQVRTQHGLE